MKKGEVLAYKLARPDGFDFHTGKTVQYRGEFPLVVRPPMPNARLGICSSGVLHASKNPNHCFVGAKIPCSAYRVRGIPACGNAEKWGFTELVVLEEITDLDKLFGWRYSEVINPIHPFKLPKCIPTDEDITLLKVWASVRDSVWASVWASVWDSVWASVWASVGDSVWAYIGSMFPGVTNWEYIKHAKDVYPFQSAADLWKRGLVPSYDSETWRMHSGEKAEIVWEGVL